MKKKEPILDQFSREHDYLRISLTDRCNLRCFYCMPEEGVQLEEKSSIMTIEEIIDISRKFVEMGVKKIRLTGGEPLIRKNIELLIRELSKMPVELAITTNGILIDRFLDLFKEVGLRSINISLDSLDKEKNLFITKRDYFDRIMQNIELYLEQGFHLKINVVPVKGVNANEIVDFIKWSRDKNISVRFIEFMPFYGNQWNWEKGVSLDQLLENIFNEFGKENVIKIPDSKNDTSLNYKIDGFSSTFAIISSVTNPFCGTCNRIRLTANGRIKNCLFSNEEFDLLSPYREGEDLENIIRKAIAVKKKERAGMDTFDKLSDEKLHNNNRSMITIGG